MTVNDSQNVNGFSRNAKDAAVVAVHQVTIPHAKYFILGYKRASFREAFKGFDVFFKITDKLFCFFRAILRDELPCFFEIALRCG